MRQAVSDRSLVAYVAQPADRLFRHRARSVARLDQRLKEYYPLRVRRDLLAAHLYYSLYLGNETEREVSDKVVDFVALVEDGDGTHRIAVRRKRGVKA